MLWAVKLGEGYHLGTEEESHNPQSFKLLIARVYDNRIVLNTFH